MSKPEFRPPGRLELFAVVVVLFLTVDFWPNALVDEAPEIDNWSDTDGGQSQSHGLRPNSREGFVTAILSHERVPKPDSEANTQAALDALNELNLKLREGHDAGLQARIEFYENSFKMQSRVASMQAEQAKRATRPHFLPLSLPEEDRLGGDP